MERRTPDEPLPGKLEYERAAAFRAQERKEAEVARSQPKATGSEPEPSAGQLEYERKAATRAQRRPRNEIGTAKTKSRSADYEGDRQERKRSTIRRDAGMRIPFKGKPDQKIVGKGVKDPRGLPDSDSSIGPEDRHLLPTPPKAKIGTAKIPTKVKRESRKETAPKSDEEKRESIKAAPGAIAWPQGELRGKKAWHVVVEPYSQATHHVVVGEKPEGATLLSGPGEAYKRIVQAAGKGRQRPVRLGDGAAGPALSTKNRRTAITFVPDTTTKRKRSSSGRSGSRTPKANSRPSGLAADVVVTRTRRGRRRHISLY